MSSLHGGESERTGLIGLIIASVLLAGCESESINNPAALAAQVAIIPLKRIYSPGEITTFRITNLGSRQLATGSCFSSLYREDQLHNWIKDRDYMDTCPSVLIMVDGYHSYETTALIPADLLPARYRVLKEFRLADREQDPPFKALSEPFSVR